MATQALKFYKKSTLRGVTGVTGGIYYSLLDTNGNGPAGIYVYDGTNFVEFANYYTHPTYSTTQGTGSETVAFGGSFQALDSLSATNGHTTAVNLQTFNMPSISIGSGTAESGKYVSAVAIDSTDKGKINITKASLPELSVTDEGTGEYVSDVTASGHTITLSRASLPSGSGSVTAGSGKYVSGITLSGHTLSGTTADLPTLSGGKAAATGKYVSGVTVSGHAVTVTQADLPELSASQSGTGGDYINGITVDDHAITYTKASLPSGSGSVTGSATSFVNSVSLSGHTLSGSTQAADTNVATGTGIPTTAAVKSYVDSTATSLLRIKGECPSDEWTAANKAGGTAIVGDAYIVKTADTYAGHVCEVGDVLLCTSAATSSVAPTWTVLQNNLDVATSSKLGTIKIGASTTGKNYPLVLNGSKQAYVSVPWTDTHYTNSLTIKGAGTAVTTFEQSADKAVDIVAGSNVTVTPDATNSKITIAATDTLPNNGTFTVYANSNAAASTSANTSGDSSVKFVGSGATSISNSGSTITVSSTDTHYTNSLTIKGAGTAVTTFEQNADKAVDIVAGSNVTITPDATNGKITIAATDTKYTVNDGSFKIKVGTTEVAGTSANTASDTTATFAAGTKLSVSGASGTVTYSHSAISRTDTTSSASPAHSGTFTCIDSVTTDTTGHVTAANVKTVTLPAQYSLPTASTTTKGGIKVDGTSITVSSEVASVIWAEWA